MPVRERQYREERSFVDLDELPELLKGAHAVLAVKTNPTSFKQFEVRYRTRGDLQLVAFNNSQGVVIYAVQVRRPIEERHSEALIIICRSRNTAT